MKSDDQDKEELTFEREQEMRAELYKLHMEMVRILQDLSYYKSEALVLVANGDAQYGDKPISIAVAYVAANKSETEREILTNLQQRLETAVTEWTEWTQTQLQANRNTPF